MSAGYEQERSVCVYIYIYVQRVCRTRKIKEMKIKEYIRKWKYNVKKFHVETCYFPAQCRF